MTNDPNLLLFAGRAALLCVAFLAFAVALVRWRRAGQRDMQTLMGQLDESRNETRGLAELTAALAAQLAGLKDSLDSRAQLAHASSTPSAGGIDLAIRLARQGSTPDEIAKTCGVTRQEAVLVARLHGTDSHRS
ncbi:MAG: DUF2802 domain-containing protein [Proteobacteria bacterium]|nr:MAG: DUF2802 domain-containing protein [Pseudomonadota bacterium]